MDVKINFRIITKNHTADSKTGSLKTVWSFQEVVYDKLQLFIGRRPFRLKYLKITENNSNLKDLILSKDDC